MLSLFHYSFSNSKPLSMYSACYLEAKSYFSACMTDIKKSRSTYNLKNALKCQKFHNQELYDCIGDGSKVVEALHQAETSFIYKLPNNKQQALALCFDKQLKKSDTCAQYRAKERAANSKLSIECMKQSARELIQCSAPYKDSFIITPPIEERLFDFERLNPKATTYKKDDFVWVWLAGSNSSSGNYKIAKVIKTGPQFVTLMLNGKPMVVSKKDIILKPRSPNIQPFYTLSARQYQKAQIISQALKLTHNTRYKMAQKIKQSGTKSKRQIKIPKQLKPFIDNISIADNVLTYKFKGPLFKSLLLRLEPRIDINSELSWFCSVNDKDSFKFMPEDCHHLMNEVLP